MDAPLTNGSAPRAGRIDVITRLAVVRTHQAQPDLPIVDLAAMYGISEASARRILAVQAADRKETVRAMLLSGAEDVIEHWFEAVAVAAAKGYHQPAKDLLIAAEAIEPKPTVAANVSVAPQIALSMNFGLGALKDYRPAQALGASDTPTLETIPVEAPSLPLSKGTDTLTARSAHNDDGASTS